jgi:hypothetical protein
VEPDGSFDLVVTGIFMPGPDAILSGAHATHTLCETGGAFLRSVDGTLRDQDDVRRDVVW